MKKKDLVSDAETAGARVFAEARMFEQNMTATELKYLLTEPRMGHSIPEKFVEDFFEFASAVHCDISLQAFYRWYHVPSLTDAERDEVAEALKAHRASLHTMLEADIASEPYTTVAAEEVKKLQTQAETVTNLINRLHLCPHRKSGPLGEYIWCVLDKHPNHIPHQYA